MSDIHQANGHDAHAAPSHSAYRKAFNLVVLLALPVVVVGSLVLYLKAQDRPPAASMSEEAVMARLQKVGHLQLGELSRELKTGEQVYVAQCTTCHAAGLVGAPKFGDASAWAPRVKNGYDALLTSALKGKGNMAAQGGAAFSDYEVGRAVVYMSNAGGAKFGEPKAPKGTAPAQVASTAK